MQYYQLNYILFSDLFSNYQMSHSVYNILFSHHYAMNVTVLTGFHKNQILKYFITL